MPTVQQQREKLISLLRELFQLDQPDLDFGFYKIMHAKAKDVTAFLENDLLKIVEEKFGQSNAAKVAQLQKAYEDAVAQAKSFGATDPEQTDPVKRAKAALEAAKDTSRAEGEVYDHLYRFFERYYDAGDFMSRRYLSRETSSKAAPYAVPYDGSEVYMHWANKDQYYIKTSEYLTNFTFDLRKAPEVRQEKADLFGKTEPAPMPVHFRVVAATEGEYGNAKASDSTKRYFILHETDPVSIAKDELVVRFEYRPDPEKTGQEKTWQAKRNNEAVAGILEALGEAADARAREYAAILTTLAPTEKHTDRPLLAKYITQYTARNTMDYFIHKDLGGFLRRELDFYMKNEVMRLDDIESADAAKVEQYLAQVGVLRQIASKMIDFLAQLEEFQKRLWLKKKFVTECHWCITLDRVPEELYAEIAANDAQREEWVRLFAIDEITADQLGKTAFSVPLSVAFLRDNPHLPIDTRFFSATFSQRLIAALHDQNEAFNGILVKGDNYQAIAMLERAYSSGIGCVYIDPPYNTGDDGFPYKDAYQSSSWLSMMKDRLSEVVHLLSRNGVIIISIGREELYHLELLCEEVFGRENRLADMVWEKGRKNDAKYFSLGQDYMLVYARSEAYLASCSTVWREEKPGAREILAEYRRLRGLHANDYALIQEGIRTFYARLPKGHPALKHRRYNRVDRNGIWRDDNISWPGGGGPRYDVVHPVTGEPCKVPERGWCFATVEKFKLYEEHGFIEYRQDHSEPPFLKRYLNYVPNDFDPDAKRRNIANDSEDSVEVNVQVMPSVFYKNSQPTVTELRNMLGSVAFPNPKDPELIARLVRYIAREDSLVLDFFAGSGTTGHAVISLNREDGGNRRYVLVEIGDYFDTVLVPRIQKVIYSTGWKDGKPVSRDSGTSHMFKYMRLESYEDCLNNLEVKDDSARNESLSQNAGLREDYMLHYMLDVETRGSASLLSIDQFADPTAYKLKVKKPGSDEYDWRNVDLLETFNYLIGLRVDHIAAPQAFTAQFDREKDPDLPKGQLGRLVLKGRLKQDPNGPWWFRKVEGWVPKNPRTPNDGQQEKVLIVWRKLTGDIEQDNLVLDEWFRKYQINPRESYDYDTIYVNGSNNLPNLKLENETWRVRLIEEDFHRLMWDTEEI